LRIYPNFGLKIGIHERWIIGIYLRDLDLRPEFQPYSMPNRLETQG